MDNPRIGMIRDEGTLWPEQDLLGRPYSKPAQTTFSLGNGQFVVVPMGMTQEQLEVAIAALRGGNVPQARTSRRGAVIPDEQPQSDS